MIDLLKEIAIPVIAGAISGVGAWLLANTNWNNASQIVVAVIVGAILAGAGSLLANDKIVGPWLPKRPWVASTFTAFSTAIIAAAIVGSVLIVTKGWLEADRAQLITDLTGRDPSPADPHDERARTYYGTVKIAKNPLKLGWDPIPIGKTDVYTDNQFYCDVGYYLIGVTLFTDTNGFIQAQIMCSKLIRSPQLTKSHQQ